MVVGAGLTFFVMTKLVPMARPAAMASARPMYLPAGERQQKGLPHLRDGCPTSPPASS